jgi:hypothetical protein
VLGRRSTETVPIRPVAVSRARFRETGVGCRFNHWALGPWQPHALTRRARFAGRSTGAGCHWPGGLSSAVSSLPILTTLPLRPQFAGPGHWPTDGYRYPPENTSPSPSPAHPIAPNKVCMLHCRSPSKVVRLCCASAVFSASAPRRTPVPPNLPRQGHCEAACAISSSSACCVAVGLPKDHKGEHRPERCSPRRSVVLEGVFWLSNAGRPQTVRVHDRAPGNFILIGFPQPSKSIHRHLGVRALSTGCWSSISIEGW